MAHNQINWFKQESVHSPDLIRTIPNWMFRQKLLLKGNSKQQCEPKNDIAGYEAIKL